MTYDELKKLMREHEIKDRIRWINNYADFIIRDANELTTGNLSHHKISIKSYAENIKEFIKFIKKDYEEKK